MRTHRFEPVPLVFGLLFAALGLSFLQGDIDLWRFNWSWIWPAALVLTGLLVLVSVRSDRTPAAEVNESEADEELTL
jgi:hypothetical protein